MTPPEVRERMGACAVRLLPKLLITKAPAPLEFIVDDQLNFFSGDEYTLAEWNILSPKGVVGVDLVREQIFLFAEGHPLPFRQKDLKK